MLTLFVQLLAVFGSGVAAQTAIPIPATALTLEAKLTPRLSPANADWVRTEATALKAVNVQDIPARLNQDMKSLGGMQGGDIAAMAFLVMMQATKDANEDLKQIMARTKGTSGSSRSASTTDQVQRAASRENALVTMLNGMVEPASRDPNALRRRQ